MAETVEFQKVQVFPGSLKLFHLDVFLALWEGLQFPLKSSCSLHLSPRYNTVQFINLLTFWNREASCV